MILFGKNPRLFQMARSILMDLSSRSTEGQWRRDPSGRVLRSRDSIPVSDTSWSYSIRVASRSSLSGSSSQITRAPNYVWPMTDIRALACKRRREGLLGVNVTKITVVNKAFELRRPVIAGSEFSIGVKVPRQQLTDAIDGVIGDSGQHHSQVGFWVPLNTRR